MKIKVKTEDQVAKAIMTIKNSGGIIELEEGVYDARKIVNILNNMSKAKKQ